jgi:hypothetical protein
MSTDPRADKISEVARKVGARPSLLDALINFETAGTYDPLIENPHPDSTAIGLIQINDPTAKDLFGMSAKALVSRYPDFDSQMDNVVLPYLEQRKRVYNADAPLFSKYTLYMAVFYPAYMNRDPDTEFPPNVQAVNPGIKTPADYARFVDARVKEAALLVLKPLPMMIVGGTVIIGLTIWYVSRRKRSKRSMR